MKRELLTLGSHVVFRLSVAILSWAHDFSLPSLSSTVTGQQINVIVWNIWHERGQFFSRTYAVTINARVVRLADA